jgi:hypothetical protein
MCQYEKNLVSSFLWKKCRAMYRIFEYIFYDFEHLFSILWIYVSHFQIKIYDFRRVKEGRFAYCIKIIEVLLKYGNEFYVGKISIGTEFR